MNHKCISLDMKSEWQEALKGVPHSFAHTWENCHAMHLTTGFTTYLYCFECCFEKDNVKIICPVSERDYEGLTDIVTPYGFSGFAGNGSIEDFKVYWNEFVNEKKYVCGYISTNPVFLKDSFYKKDEAYQTTELYYINLSVSLTELFENLDSNRRREIKNYKKKEIDFIYDRKILKEFFIENYYDFLKRIKASQANYFKEETLENICDSYNVFMVGAGEKEKPEAVYIFGYTEYMGDCLFNVALPGGREYTSVLLWCGLKFFRSKKIPLMCLGGGSREDDSIALSKQRFGAYRKPYINLKQIYNKKQYDLLCTRKGVNPNDVSGYFPAYRKN